MQRVLDGVYPCLSVVPKVIIVDDSAPTPATACKTVAAPNFRSRAYGLHFVTGLVLIAFVISAWLDDSPAGESGSTEGIILSMLAGFIGLALVPTSAIYCSFQARPRDSVLWALSILYLPILSFPVWHFALATAGFDSFAREVLRALCLVYTVASLGGVARAFLTRYQA